MVSRILYHCKLYFNNKISVILLDFSSLVKICLIVTADDAMEAWDQEKLEDVVNEKHGTKNKSLPPTTIVGVLNSVYSVLNSVYSVNFIYICIYAIR